MTPTPGARAHILMKGIYKALEGEELAVGLTALAGVAISLADEFPDQRPHVIAMLNQTIVEIGKLGASEGPGK